MITIGSTWQWVPDSVFEACETVTVTGERKGGCWKLSNGWVVDRDGIAEGSERFPGGHIEPRSTNGVIA